MTNKTDTSEEQLIDATANGKFERDEPLETEHKIMNRVPKGLPNLGNTCFFNSVMQCLMNTHSVSLYFEQLSKLELIENRHEYSTKICDKIVDVPVLRIQLSDTAMPLVASFKSFYDDFCNKRAPSPSGLFNQICRKAPRFRGFAQQDAHELLRYMLDGLRQEEIDRFKRDFSTHVKDEPSDTQDEKDTLIFLYKALLEGPARPVLDATFGGTLQQSIKCLSCGFISIRYEPFFDLSLPLQRSKESFCGFPGELTKKQWKLEKQMSEAHNTNNNKPPPKLSKHQKKKESKKKKKNKKAARNRRESSSTQHDDATTVTGNTVENREETTNKSITTSAPDVTDNETTDDEENAVLERDEEDNKEKSAGDGERCASRLADDDDIAELAELPFDGSNTLSVTNALRLFTMPETLSASNAYECEKCCARKKGDTTSQRKSVDASKRYLICKPPLVLTLHLKRFEQAFFLGKMTTKKFRGIVEFTDTLDLAPFCRKSVKCINPEQNKVLYSLYGVVSHSGDLGGGHYVAYVRTRPQMESIMRTLFDRSVQFEPDSLSDIITQKCKELSLNENGFHQDNNRGKLTETPNELTEEKAQKYLEHLKTNNKWYHISDSSVHVVEEARVMTAEAYILFYERIY